MVPCPLRNVELVYLNALSSSSHENHLKRDVNLQSPSSSSLVSSLREELTDHNSSPSSLGEEVTSCISPARTTTFAEEVLFPMIRFHFFDSTVPKTTNFVPPTSTVTSDVYCTPVKNVELVGPKSSALFLHHNQSPRFGICLHFS